MRSFVVKMFSLNRKNTQNVNLNWTLNSKPVEFASQYGAIAQLVERNTGSVEVSGSIPLGSTNSKSVKI